MGTNSIRSAPPSATQPPGLRTCIVPRAACLAQRATSVRRTSGLERSPFQPARRDAVLLRASARGRCGARQRRLHHQGRARQQPRWRAVRFRCACLRCCPATLTRRCSRGAAAACPTARPSRRARSGCMWATRWTSCATSAPSRSVARWTAASWSTCRCRKTSGSAHCVAHSRRERVSPSSRAARPQRRVAGTLALWPLTLRRRRWTPRNTRSWSRSRSLTCRR